LSSFREQNGLVSNWHISELEQQELLKKLWDLLKWQAGKYNGIDSTSMPIEKAEELFASLVYTLMVVASEENISIEELLQKDFQAVIRRGQEILDYKRKSVKSHWSNMCLSAPYIENICFVETIKNIGLFFERYDIYYTAHQIPCNIDYPLMNPVSDEIKGISYIEEYINRIELENSFINSFEHQIVIRLFESNIPDYKEAYFNLCELVFINALGLKLIGQEIYSLDISKDQQNEIFRLLRDKMQDQCYAMIDAAAKSVCNDVGIVDMHMASYYDKAVKELSIRIHSALKNGDLSHIFVSLLPEGVLPGSFESF